MKNFGFVYRSTFVYIWQLLSNHKLTRFKRFVLQIICKLCNYLFILSIFNTPYMRPKIQCDEESRKFLKIEQQGVSPYLDNSYKIQTKVL